VGGILLFNLFLLLRRDKSGGTKLAKERQPVQEDSKAESDLLLSAPLLTLLAFVGFPKHFPTDILVR